jgi:hypothetical protein
MRAVSLSIICFRQARAMILKPCFATQRSSSPVYFRPGARVGTESDSFPRSSAYKMALVISTTLPCMKSVLRNCVPIINDRIRPASLPPACRLDARVRV